MNIRHQRIPNPPHRLVPFVLLSLLLHAALLYLVRPATHNSLSRPRPIEVYFSAPATPEPARMADISAAKRRDKPPMSSAPRLTPERIAQPEAPPPAAFNPQQLIESAKIMARDEARKAEQQFAAEEKRKANTPIGSLAQYLRQPHEEIRLANGMLKIVTDAGEVCFQPPPTFARDLPGLYGMPVTCP